MREVVPVPLLVKGIMTAEDVRIAVDVGVDGIVVSNHCGRQLDSVHAPVTVLPEVVEAVGGRVQVLVDGGSGAGGRLQGARARREAALVARPTCWGLAIAGEEGVVDVLRILRGEFENTMVLAGRRSVAYITHGHVERAWREGPGSGPSRSSRVVGYLNRKVAVWTLPSPSVSAKVLQDPA